MVSKSVNINHVYYPCFKNDFFAIAIQIINIIDSVIVQSIKNRVKRNWLKYREIEKDTEWDRKRDR